MPERIDIGTEELNQLLERARERLSAEDYRKLKAAVDTLEYLTELVADKDTTIRHLRQLLLPASTEKPRRSSLRWACHRVVDEPRESPQAVPSSHKRIHHRATDATAPRPSREPGKCKYLTRS